MISISNTIKRVCGTNDKSKILKGNGLIVFLSAITLLGMLLGTAFINFISLSTIKKLDILFLSDFDSRVGQNSIYTFISSISSSFIFWILLILVSLSFAGPILVPLVLIFRSGGLGMTAGYLYLIYGVKGVAFYILVMLPGMFISSMGFILMSLKSVKFSLKVAKKFLPNPNGEEIWPNMILYIKWCLYTLVVLTGSSLIDMFCISIFCKLFTF